MDNVFQNIFDFATASDTGTGVIHRLHYHCYFCLVFLMRAARLFICALRSLARKGLSIVMSYCEVVTFPIVSWVRFGAWLYRFLIFDLFLSQF